MPRIQALESHVAELIAAGEVVERPASVVKELVENSVDAGASVIKIEIRRGGLGMIRISDNGCGIAPDEIPTAFLRHATSKLRNPEDLADIRTLGFRGEALAAICAVSRVEIVTREKGALSGAMLQVEGGEQGEAEETGTPEGTVITVRDLFYNTPARLKFMRKDNAEAAAVGDLIRHLALSRPDISFDLRKDDMPALHTPGDGELISAIYAALGRDFASTLIPADGRGGKSGNEIEIEGFVTMPVHGRGSRSMQAFFVNGRFIKSQLLTTALEEAYRNQLLKGKFPGCVLNIKMPPDQVDVNVHPAKTQIKFARERELFDIIYHTVLEALMAHGSPIPAPGYSRADHDFSGYGRNAGNNINFTANPRGDFFQNMDARTYRARMNQAGHNGGANGNNQAQSQSQSGKVKNVGADVVLDNRKPRVKWTGNPPVSAHDYNNYNSGADVESPPPGWDDEKNISPENDNNNYSGELESTPPGWDDEKNMPPENDNNNYPEELESPPPGWDDEKNISQDESDKLKIESPLNAQLSGQEAMTSVIAIQQDLAWRMIGEAFRTYIICESGDDLWLIDKHAAHERVNFDKLQNMKESESPIRQTLLTPAAIDLERRDAALLLENIKILDRLGFACEDFGDGAILVREIPDGMDPEEIPAALEELAENFRTGRSVEERRDAALRTVACKMSIKGGWENSEQELNILIEKVRSGEIRFCPHGRPVAVKITKRELEKKFRRT